MNSLVVHRLTAVVLLSLAWNFLWPIAGTSHMSHRVHPRHAAAEDLT